ncbi:ArsR family transcriptional regulator [Geoglobus acetivorans]|uniref:ArsR family transcriptional regulator n=1 Tax=Geoglobus acetivorans TaxID=565033 RepID=A0ABZ3H2W2_GEOAI|nr:ArsR family transcriptional regulator [Geoglobus acetivorans]
MSVERLFLHEKAVDIIVKIYEAEKNGELAYPLSISREVGSPYSYISKVLGIFEDNALVESEFEGRIRKVKLTDDGKKVAELLIQLKGLLNRDFVARKKLKIIEDVFMSLDGHRGEKALRILLPLKAELERVESNDREVIERVEELRKRIEEIINAQ